MKREQDRLYEDSQAQICWYFFFNDLKKNLHLYIFSLTIYRKVFAKKYDETV